MKILKSKIISLLFLPLLSGIILGISAIPSKLWLLNFIAYIPLLIATGWTIIQKRPLRIFIIQMLITLVTFYTWVSLWIFRTANLGFLVGFLIVLPYIIFVTPYILLKKNKNRLASVYFIAAWLTAEFLQSYYQLGSPLFNLGNSLGAMPNVIQWYEFTGATGGSLWILAANLTFSNIIENLKGSGTGWIKQLLLSAGILLLPVIISLAILRNYKEKGPLSVVMIIHPNTDCYNVKYQINIFELMDIYLGIMMPQLDSNTDYVILPETAITNAGWVSDLNNNLVFDHFHERTAGFPDLKLVTGAITYEAIPDVEKIKGYKRIPGIRYSEKYKVWYYTYNSALFIEKGNAVQMRVKEGLVPYQEYSPYPRLMPKLSPVGVDFQFSFRKSNLQVFVDKDRKKTSALICYELVFGNKFNRAARDGAEAFLVLLNEGWYINTPKVNHQFLQLAVIRAIENRRSIAHSSNMGISSFINQKGEITSSQASKEPGYLKNEIRMNKKLTFFTIMGDYLGKTALFISIILIFIEIGRNLINK